MRTIILTIFLYFTALGCDPIVSKLDYKNNTNDIIYVRTFFFSEDFSINTHSYLIKINAKEIESTGSIYDFETIFKRHNNDSLLNVVIFENYPFLMEEYGTFKTHKSDSLLIVGNYMIRSYTYKELEKKDWLITYPDDGFKQGKPLMVNNGNVDL